MRDLLDRHPLVLIEAAVVERMRRSAGRYRLHPRLENATAALDGDGRRALGAIHREYLDVAASAALPIVLCAPTWRANRERVLESGLAPSILLDAVGTVRAVAAVAPEEVPEVRVAGLLGCRGDAYRPEQGLSEEEAARFHAWQADGLAAAAVDVLIASTMPALPEAIGMARALAATGAPFVISFVIGRDGRLLDGTTLERAIDAIDDRVPDPPLGYAVNCAHPTFLRLDDRDPAALERLVGYQANASSLDHADLDGALAVHEDDTAAWGREMVRIHETAGVPILGGCCGTDARHLEAIVRARGAFG